jgi:hypothetical protein
VKFRCRKHGVELEVTSSLRKYSGLTLMRVPQCVLFTMKEPKEGRFGECEVVRVE